MNMPQSPRPSNTFGPEVSVLLEVPGVHPEQRRSSHKPPRYPNFRILIDTFDFPQFSHPDAGYLVL